MSLFFGFVAGYALCYFCGAFIRDLILKAWETYRKPKA